MLRKRSNVERAANDRRRERESLRARLRVVADLAIGNHVARARAALDELRTSLDFSDEEMVARYHLGVALLLLKERSLDEAFAIFELGVAAARRCGDATIVGGLLTNYAAASVQDGSVSTAIECLEEHQRLQPSGARTFVAPLTLVEALFAAGALQRAALLLHELYDRYADSPALISAASVGIPLGLLIEDRTLLAKSHDLALLDLAFVRGEQWLIGPLLESFCMLYEHEGLRAEHDELLQAGVERMTTLDNSLPFAIRAARTGDARILPRLAKLVAIECPPTSTLQIARQCWFDATLAVRHGRLARSRTLAVRAADGFARTERPVLQAAALASASLLDEANEVLRSCGATAFPRLSWKAALAGRRITKLTARELEVAKLAAGGLSNRAIAETLLVSERTVHRHCDSIFGKLGIHSRWQLPGALQDAQNRG
jgi:ATP/maltotriose-dependent transcriptional regulator MalT